MIFFKSTLADKYYPRLIRRFCKNMGSPKDHFPNFRVTTTPESKTILANISAAKIETIRRCESRANGVGTYL